MVDPGAKHACPETVSEERLAERAAAGDRVAFGRLIEQHQRTVHAYLLSIVRNPETARDLAQDTFVRVWKGLPGYDPGRPFKTWLLTIATNVSRNHFRGVSRFYRACEGLRERLVDAPRTPTPRDIYRENCRESLVHQAIDQLPDNYRRLVWLKYFEDCSSIEIGEIVGLSAGAVDMRLTRARKILRNRLACLAPQETHDVPQADVVRLRP